MAASKWEARTKTIDLPEDDEYAVAALIHFAYNGEYDARKIFPLPQYECHATLLHVQVVALAQKYFIEPLQDYASKQALELMKTWGAACSTCAKTVYKIYTETEDVSVGSLLREGAVKAVMDNGLHLFESKRAKVVRTREILLDETPGFVEEWGKAMSHRNRTLASANTDLEAVNGILNRDNVKLNDRHSILQDTYDQLKASDETFREETRKDQLKDKVNVPDRPTSDIAQATRGREPGCYRCPNCEVIFFRVIHKSGRYTHQCFPSGWCGKLGKSGLDLTHKEWQEHHVQRT